MFRAMYSELFKADPDLKRHCMLEYLLGRGLVPADTARSAAAVVDFAILDVEFSPVLSFYDLAAPAAEARGRFDRWAALESRCREAAALVEPAGTPGAGPRHDEQAAAAAAVLLADVVAHGLTGCVVGKAMLAEDRADEYRQLKPALPAAPAGSTTAGAPPLASLAVLPAPGLPEAARPRFELGLSCAELTVRSRLRRDSDRVAHSLMPPGLVHAGRVLGCAGAGGGGGGGGGRVRRLRPALLQGADCLHCGARRRAVAVGDTAIMLHLLCR